MTAEELMDSLIQRLGLTDLESEGPGRWRIVFDADVAVDFQIENGSGIRLETVLGPLPEDEYWAETAVRAVLQRNLTQLNGVAQNVVFLHSDRPILSISRTENAENSDSESFAACVEDFVNAAEAWLEFLAVEAAPTPPGLAMRL